MKKIILFAFIFSCLNASDFHGAVVDEAQNDKIFGSNPSDAQTAYGHSRLQFGGGCGEFADCTSFYNQTMNAFRQRVKVNLEQQLTRWKESNEKLTREKIISSYLPKAQIEYLVLEKTKLNKIEELRFYLEKQVKIEEKSGNELKLKSFLAN